MLKKWFPHAYRVKGLISLLVTILIYLVIGAVIGWVISLLAKVPVVGLLCGILGTVLDVYCAAGIILSLLVFFKIVK